MRKLAWEIIESQGGKSLKGEHEARPEPDGAERRCAVIGATPRDARELLLHRLGVNPLTASPRSAKWSTD